MGSASGKRLLSVYELGGVPGKGSTAARPVSTGWVSDLGDEWGTGSQVQVQL